MSPCSGSDVPQDSDSTIQSQAWIPSDGVIHGGFHDRALTPEPGRGGCGFDDVTSCPEKTAVRPTSCSASMQVVREGSWSSRPATIPSSRFTISLSIRSSCFCET